MVYELICYIYELATAWCGWNVCVPSEFACCSPKHQCDSAGRHLGLEQVIGLGVCGESSIFITGKRRVLLCPHGAGTQGSGHCLQPRKRLPPGWESLVTLTLNFQPPEMWGKKHLLFVSLHPSVAFVMVGCPDKNIICTWKRLSSFLKYLFIWLHWALVVRKPTWRGAAQPGGRSGSCCSCWSLSCHSGRFSQTPGRGEDGISEPWTQWSWFPPSIQWSFQGSQLPLDRPAHKLNKVPFGTQRASWGQAPAALSNPHPSPPLWANSQE